MALLTIPVADRTARQSQVTTLDGKRYRITLDWLQRVGRWVISVETLTGSVILRTKGLALGTDLFKQVRQLPECPPGTLTLVDTQGQDVEASLDTLGGRHLLLYFEAL